MSVWIHRGLVALAAALALFTALRTPPVLYGDAREYLLMAESLANHATPDLRPEDLTSFEALCRRSGIAESTEVRLIGYYEADDGRRYSYHFWGYSLALLPLKLLLRGLGGNELKAAQLLNALLMTALLAFVAWRPFLLESQKLLLNGLLFFSPAVWFILWPHPEVFSFVFAALALVLRLGRRFHLAILCAALAALQNPQLMLLAGLLWLEAVVRVRVRLRPVFAMRASARWRDALTHALAALPFFVHPLFFYAHFGVPSVVGREATSIAKLSLSRALDLLFDLNLGLLPYIPLALLLYLLVVARAAWSSRSFGPPVRLFLVFAALLLVNTLQWNFNHGSSGPSRYVIWMMPIVFVTLAAEARSRGAMAALAFAVAVQAGIVASRGGLIPRDDYLEHSAAAAYVLDRWPWLYDPDYEVFIKRTLHVEGRPTHGPYAYIVRGRCRKVLANRTHEAEVRQICGDIPERYLPFFRAEAGSRRRREWTYVNY